MPWEEEALIRVNRFLASLPWWRRQGYTNDLAGFDLARLLRLVPGATVPELGRVASLFARRVGVDPELTYRAFDYWWANIDYPVGKDKLDVAFQQAAESNLRIIPDPGRDVHLALTAYLLQRVNGEKPFTFPTKRIGQLMGYTHQAAGKARERLATKKVIEWVSTSRTATQRFRRGRADEFRFIGQAIDQEQPQQPGGQSRDDEVSDPVRQPV